MITRQYVIITFDEQLYKILIDLIWVYPLQLGKVVARLGGMHFLMTFIGCIDNLLVNSGLIDILNSAFGGVDKMLTGKKFPQNVGALRMVTEELLRPYLKNMETADEFMKFLQDISAESKTAKLWMIDNLIRPVIYSDVHKGRT